MARKQIFTSIIVLFLGMLILEFTPAYYPAVNFKNNKYKTNFTDMLDIKSNDMMFHIFGMKSGKPVLILLHGFPESGLVTWQEIIPQLSESYTLIIPDLRGYGCSTDGFQHTDYRHKFTVRENAIDVIRIMDHLNINKAYIAGHDLGGLITWYLVTMYPHRFEKSIILSTPHPLSYKENAGFVQYYKSRYVAYFQIDGFESFMQINNWRWLDHMALSHGTFDIETVEKLHKEWDHNMPYMLAYYKTLSLLPEDYIRELDGEKIVMPTRKSVLLIRGATDFAFDSRVFDSSCNYIKDNDNTKNRCSIQIIDNADHFLIHDQPGQVVHLMMTWLSFKD